MDGYEKKTALFKRLNITDEKFKRLGELWFIYGNGAKKHRPAHHYIIQGIIEHGINRWKTWEMDASDEFKTIMQKEFPEIVNDDSGNATD